MSERIEALAANIQARLGEQATRRTALAGELSFDLAAGSLVESLTALRDDPALRARFGAAAHARAVRDFGLDPMLDRMEAVFRAVSKG